MYGGMLGGQEEKDALMKVVNSNWWPLYKQGELMEKESAKFIGKNMEYFLTLAVLLAYAALLHWNYRKVQKSLFLPLPFLLSLILSFSAGLPLS